MNFSKAILATILLCSFYFGTYNSAELKLDLEQQQINIEKPGKLTGWNPGFRDCVNDDSTSDSYGDTCSSWYDDYEYEGSGGCSGNYNDDDFNAAEQCCVCGGGSDDGDGGGDPPTCEDQGLWDCGDGQCIPPAFVCDGSSEFCNAGWGPDCDNGADEGLDSCGYTDDCEAPTDCELAGGTESYNSDGWCDASNNNDGCGWDGGDCCPSTCVDGTYSCEAWGGTCDTCLDPGASDSNYQGTCTPPCDDSAACNFGDLGDCEYESCYNFAGFVGWNSNIEASSSSSFDCELNLASTTAGVASPEDACAVGFSDIEGSFWNANACSSLGAWTVYECKANAPTNQFYLGNATENSVDVLYWSAHDIGGFQISINGATVTATSGGAAADAGFGVFIGTDYLLGYAESTGFIPAGQGLLTTLSIEGYSAASDACIGDLVISDVTGSSAAALAMTILDDHNVGIGEGSPDARLTVAGTNRGATGTDSDDATGNEHQIYLIEGSMGARVGEWVHSTKAVAPSGGTQTPMISWYKFVLPGGYSGAGTPGFLEITNHMTGMHASGSAVEQYKILFPNAGSSNSAHGGMNLAYVDKVYALTRNVGSYTTSISTVFYYLNSGSGTSGGTMFMKVTHASREPFFTMHARYIGGSGNNQAYHQYMAFLGTEETNNHAPANITALTTNVGQGVQ